MKIAYQKVLTLEIWHDYYLGQSDSLQSLPSQYDISEILTLVPTQHCRQVLRNLRWVFRSQPQGGNILAQVIADSPDKLQTLIPLDRPSRLTFWLVVKDSNFANFTNLPLSDSRQQIYYFSNLSGNQAQSLFLSKPLENYTEGKEYRLGQLVTDNGHTLEAISYQQSATATPDTTNDWKELPESQYVSEADQLLRQGLSRTQILAKANPGAPYRFFLKDVNGEASLAAEGNVPDTHPPGTPLPVGLNLSHRHPGYYRLFENETEIEKFVLLDPLVAGKAFALVEIVLNPSLVPGTFSLLQPGEENTQIRPQTYVIRFKNRATRWRYRYQNPHHFCLPQQQPGTEGCIPINPQFVVLDERSYATQRPLGLRQRPPLRLNDGIKDLPTPGVGLIKPEKDESQQVAAIFSDIHPYN